MKVTEVPLQTVVIGVVITMFTVFTVFSTIVIALEVAGFPVGQAIFEFKTQKIWSAFVGTY